MKTSEKIEEISQAMVEMQSQMGIARKGSVNPYFKSKYADLPSVWQAIREPLHENGLCVVQNATTEEKGVAVTTTIFHKSGQWIEFGPLTIPLAKMDAHACGSAISYAKRYGLAAALGIVAEEDDDGNRAVKAAKKNIEVKHVEKEELFSRLEKLFDRDILEDYVKERAQHYKHKEQDSINQIAIIPEKDLKAQINIWMQKREKDTTD